MYAPLQNKMIHESNPLQRELADSIVKMVPLDDIRILLATGAKVNEPVTQGLRPLHYAVWQRYPEAVRLLLVRGGDINARDECGYSALHLSAEHGYTELVALLLRMGARVDYREDTDEPYPRTTLCDEPLRLAIRNRHTEVARMLLENGANPNKKYFFGTEINLVSPLDLEFMNLLLMFGADPNSRDRTGLTPLMKAARLPQGMESVLLLLSYGADINAIADSRHAFSSALAAAILSESVDTVKLLIKQGANVNPVDDGSGPRRLSCLQLAISKHNLQLIMMLIEAGADVNSITTGGAALHTVCDETAAATETGNNNYSCLERQYQFFRVLLAAGANPNIVVDQQEDDIFVQSVLSRYFYSNVQPCPAIIRLFLRFGARVMMKTHFRHPLGILDWIRAATRDEHVFRLLLAAAESFDICMIRRNQYLSDEQRVMLLDLATNPLPLQQQARLFIRKQLGSIRLPLKIQQLPIPKILQDYLMFDLL